MAEWQNIATAPKTGESIMIWVEEDRQVGPHCFAPVSICDDGTWWDDSTGDQIEPIERATHWHPPPLHPL